MLPSRGTHGKTNIHARKKVFLDLGAALDIALNQPSPLSRRCMTRLGVLPWYLEGIALVGYLGLSIVPMDGQDYD